MGCRALGNHGMAFAGFSAPNCKMTYTNPHKRARFDVIPRGQSRSCTPVAVRTDNGLEERDHASSSTLSLELSRA